MKTVMTLSAVITLAGCSSILGFKDPKLQDVPEDAAQMDAMIDAGSLARCKPTECAFGCDTTTDACRDGVVWIYLSAGAFAGDAFGGTGTNVDVRGGADALCRKTYTESATLTTRSCNLNRVHAVISIGSADTIALMSSNPAIMVPTSVPVQRGLDAAVIANNWNDFTDINTTPRVAVLDDVDQNNGLVWTGFNSTTATCKGWTSELGTDSGVQGHATMIVGNWWSRSSVACSNFARLVCACWSGGQ